MGKQVVLRHDTMAGLEYGPDTDSSIKFGGKGGAEPFFAIVDSDHPLLEQLLNEDPDVHIWEPDGPSVVWVCPFHEDKQFRTKEAFKRHLETKGHEALQAAQAAIDATPPAGATEAEEPPADQPPA